MSAPGSGRVGTPCDYCHVTMTPRRPGRNARPADHYGNGYCKRDWKRWRDNGYPAGGPPPPRRLHTWAPVTARVEDYLFLTGEGLDRYQVAARLGVTVRTVQRWAAAAREQAAA